MYRQQRHQSHAKPPQPPTRARGAPRKLRERRLTSQSLHDLKPDERQPCDPGLDHRRHNGVSRCTAIHSTKPTTTSFSPSDERLKLHTNSDNVTSPRAVCTTSNTT